jgi:uncharacterized protein (TIGR02001 family)
MMDGVLVMKKKIVLLMSAFGLLGVGTQAFAGASAGVAVTSNYVGRGLTQTQDDDPALQLDLNYTTQSGLYADVWGSNVKFGGVRDQEWDYSVGFKKELDNGFGFDVGAVKYDYPKHSSPNYSEAYAKLSYKGVGAEVYRTVSTQDQTGGIQNGDLYYALTYEHDLANDWKYTHGN